MGRPEATVKMNIGDMAVLIAAGRLELFILD
jgi:hypothetical protein